MLIQSTVVEWLNTAILRPSGASSRIKAFTSIQAAHIIGSVRASLPHESSLWKSPCGGGSNMPAKKPSKKAGKAKGLKVKKLSKTQTLSEGAGAGKVTFNPF